ncbi:alkaline phosphatase family protein [Psychroserpens ponticola]|uniref:Sulfatase N-terminal domain-containing protein n=1 Tax=Psychroserpens ponticola TaxID=2932268 RepID=A0ABY7RVQ5_9FLAO|nr:hypothetical protein [Psychroserpens ponticola]WCO00842.1 hypothetical protein MUN68_012285 [Psychroserpens ponticola]
MREKINRFINSTKDFPVISALAAGFFPLIHYYSFNLTLADSQIQLVFLVSFFLILPVIMMLFFRIILKQTKINFYIIPVLNYMLFGIFISIVLLGLKFKYIVAIAVVTFLLGVFGYKFLKKIIVFQYLLGLLSLCFLVPKLVGYFNYSNTWLEQDDNIMLAEFKQKPNIYFIQVDGYANFSALKEQPYSFDNSDFETFLGTNGFKFYDDFRSNYYSTLSSNASMFAMKHHYYFKPNDVFAELHNARKVVVSDNPVLSILKHNNYKTFLICESSYFLTNRPKLSYDFTNIENNQLSFFGHKTNKDKKDIRTDLKTAILENKDTNNFFFIQKMSPQHIRYHQLPSDKMEEERNDYLERLNVANNWLTEMIDFITKTDDNALIVIHADHGGYVGFNSMAELVIKQTDKALVNSIYSSILAIKWPENKAPVFDENIKSSVNIFRILVSYLSKNTDYLNHLQPDKSYIVIDKGAPFGVYEYLNDKGELVFNKFE